MSAPQPGSTLGTSVRKWAVRILTPLVVLFWLVVLLALFSADAFLLELPFHLIGGWVLYPMQVQSQIRMNYDLLWSSLVALGVAVAGFHGIAGWLWKQSRPSAGPWRFRWTAAITTMLLLLFASANAGAGIGHQIGWLKSMPWIYNRMLSMRQRNNGRQLGILITEWALNHNDQRPRKLTDLITTDAEEGLTAEEYQRLGLVRCLPESTPEPWLYVGAELTDKAPEDLPLLVSPRPWKGKRIVVRNWGAAVTETEEEYQKQMEALRRYLSEAGKTH